MKQARATAQPRTDAEIARWKWLLLGLIATIAILLAMSQTAPANGSIPEMPYIAAAADAHADCDGTHGLVSDHCVSTTCTAHAQLDAGAAAFLLLTCGHPLPIAEGIGLGQSPRPNLQPPQNSSQA